ENQLKQANFEFDELCRFQAIKEPSATVQEGSLVQVGSDKYLISISLGQVSVDGEKLFMLSKNSPLGEILVGSKRNDQDELRCKSILITEILYASPNRALVQNASTRWFHRVRLVCLSRFSSR